jgi:hypothetical protein
MSKAARRTRRRTGTGTAAERMWRTQIHVIDMIRYRNAIFIDIPGLGSGIMRSWPLSIRLDRIPAGIAAALHPGSRTYAQVNLGAESLEDVRISGWEMPS